MIMRLSGMVNASKYQAQRQAFLAEMHSRQPKFDDRIDRFTQPSHEGVVPSIVCIDAVVAAT